MTDPNASDVSYVKAMQDFREHSGGIVSFYFVRHDDPDFAAAIDSRDPEADLLIRAIGDTLQAMSDSLRSGDPRRPACLACDYNFSLAESAPAAFVIMNAGMLDSTKMIASPICAACLSTKSTETFLELAKHCMEQIFHGEARTIAVPRDVGHA